MTKIFYLSALLAVAITPLCGMEKGEQKDEQTGISRLIQPIFEKEFPERAQQVVLPNLPEDIENLILEYVLGKKLSERERYDLTNNNAYKALIPTQRKDKALKQYDGRLTDIVGVYPSSGPLVNSEQNIPSIWFYGTEVYSPGYYKQYTDVQPKCFIANALQMPSSVCQRTRKSDLPGFDKIHFGMCTIMTRYHRGSFFANKYWQSYEEFNKFEQSKQKPFFVASSSNGNVVGVIKNFYNKFYSNITLYIKKGLMNQFLNKWNGLDEFYAKIDCSKRKNSDYSLNGLTQRTGKGEKSEREYDIDDDDFLEVTCAGDMPENATVTAFCMSRFGHNILISVQEEQSTSLVCISTDKIINIKQIKKYHKKVKTKNNMPLYQRIIGSMYNENNIVFGVPFNCFSEETQHHFTSLAHLGKRHKTGNDEFLGVDTEGALCLIELSSDNKITIKEVNLEGYSFKKVNVNHNNPKDIVSVIEKKVIVEEDEQNKPKNNSLAICYMRFNEESEECDIVEIKKIKNTPQYIGFDNDDIIFVNENDTNAGMVAIERIPKLMLYNKRYNEGTKPLSERWQIVFQEEENMINSDFDSESDFSEDSKKNNTDQNTKSNMLFSFFKKLINKTGGLLRYGDPSEFILLVKKVYAIILLNLGILSPKS